MDRPGVRRPKYLLAEETILKAIRDGRFTPGQQLPGETRLAEELGIAYMTARHAVTRLVDQGHLERRRGVGTFVRTRTHACDIALLIMNLSRVDAGTLPARELEMVRAMAEAEGTAMQVMVLLRPLPPPEKLLSDLRAMGVGAVGWIGFINSDRSFIETVATRLPGVLFNKGIPGVALPYSAPDMGSAARQMIEYFVSRGRKRVGLATLSAEHSLQSELMFAVESELQRRGLAIDKSLWYQEADYAEGHAPMNRWIESTLARPDRPDALVVPTRDVLIVAERNAARLGVRMGVELDGIALYSGTRANARSDRWPLMALNYTDVAPQAARHLLDLASGRASAGSAPVWKSAPELILPGGAPGA